MLSLRCIQFWTRFFLLLLLLLCMHSTKTWTNITSNQHMRGSIFITGTSKIIRRKVFLAGTICLCCKRCVGRNSHRTFAASCFHFCSISFWWHRSEFINQPSHFAILFFFRFSKYFNRILNTCCVEPHFVYFQSPNEFKPFTRKVKYSEQVAIMAARNFQMLIFQKCSAFSFVCAFTMHFWSHQLIAAMILISNTTEGIEMF